MEPRHSMRREMIDSGANVLAHVIALVVSLIMMAMGIAMGVTIVLLPIGVPVGFAGLFLFLWALFDRRAAGSHAP